MACELKPSCDFSFRYLWCSLPRNTIDNELTARTIQGIHAFRKDCPVKSAPCSPWSRWVKSFLFLQKKIEAYEEEKRDEKGLFHPNPNPFTKRSPFQKRPRENKQKRGRSKVRKVDMSRFALPKAKRSVNLWALLPTARAMVTTTTNTMPTTAILKMNTTTNFKMTCSCRTCKRWGLPCPFHVKSALHPSCQESDWSDEDWDGDRHRVREQKKKVNCDLTTTTAACTDVDCLSDTETAPICKVCKTR